MQKRVALITWAGLLQGARSEQLLLPLLAAAGVEARMVDWRDARVRFSQFDLVVLRSCWDYHLYSQEFKDWLLRTDQEAPVLNNVETVLWNSNKSYLRELEALGIQIAPTCFVAGGERVDENHRAQMESWDRIVVKPAISASAYKTQVFESRSLPAADALAASMGGADFLVQQFVPEIQTSGEISFIYIDGKYSHAVLKRPAKGDFRVQQEHGGSAELFDPPDSLLQQAQAIAEMVAEVSTSLYCRLDAVAKGDQLVLMELELIEPELFLGLAEGAAERFAQAIARRAMNARRG